jgi:hypothetical protein
MALISFKVSSNLTLARCRELIKQHERPVIPVNTSLKAQVIGLPTIYGFFWLKENVFHLTRWRYVTPKGSPPGYRPGIELMGEVKEISGKPFFLLQTKSGEGKRILSMIISCFVIFGVVFGVIAAFATDPIAPVTWLYFSALPTLLSLIFFFDFALNAFLCRRFLKRLVNPKSSKNTSLIVEG